MGMWFFGRYVNGGGPTNLVAPLQLVKRNASIDRMWEDFLALGATRGDDERKRGNERIWENEGVKRCEEKKEGREVFVEKREELWRMWRGEEDEENEEEERKETVGNYWRKWKCGNTLDG